MLPLQARNNLEHAHATLTAHTAGAAPPLLAPAPCMQLTWSRRARVATCSTARYSVLLICSPLYMPSILARRLEASARSISSCQGGAFGQWADQHERYVMRCAAALAPVKRLASRAQGHALLRRAGQLVHPLIILACQPPCVCMCCCAVPSAAAAAATAWLFAATSRDVGKAVGTQSSLGHGRAALHKWHRGSHHICSHVMRCCSCLGSDRYHLFRRGPLESLSTAALPAFAARLSGWGSIGHVTTPQCGTSTCTPNLTQRLDMKQ